MVILIGNQKGGAGKSTLTILLANYLTLIKKLKTIVLDLDYQQSISVLAEKSIALENEAPYEVVASDLKHFPLLLDIVNKNNEDIILIDLPGKMDDDLLIPVLKSGDLILCPFNYDPLSVDSTLLFVMVTKKINDNAPIVFIPNRIKNTVKYETQIEVDKLFNSYGEISPIISDRIDFQRVTTVNTPLILMPIILPVLNLIFQKYLIP